MIEINIADDQVEDCLEDAFQFYQEYHSDAVLRSYRKHQITSTDLTNKYITLPDSLLFVSRVLPIVTSFTSTSSLFSVNYQLALNTIQDLYRDLDLVTYEMTRQHMNLVDMTFNGLDQMMAFSRHMNRLHIQTDWGKTLKEGDYIVIEGYEIIDPEEHTAIYNDLFLKRYLTALLKKQWATNLKKFEGVQLPGGVTINAQSAFDEAVSEITELETEMDEKWSTPPGFFVG